MIPCCKQMLVLQTNWWTGGEPKETLLLLWNDDLLLLMDLHPSRTFRDRWRTEGDIVSTLRWWFLAPTRAESFKEIDGQVENRRRNCFYSAMMICCCWWISVLQGYLGTGRKPKEKMFLLCDDELFPLIDVRPLNKLMEKSRTEGEIVYTLRWWSVAENTCFYLLIQIGSC